MILRPRFIVRATLVVVSLLALMPFVPAPARAIQLRWSTGSTDLTVSQNTQAVLVVQADSAEVTLPNSWRLQWTADSLAVQFSPFDPNSACLVDTAKVDSIMAPQTPADSAANEVTAYFCSSGSNNAATAYFQVDVPGNGHGKLKVVALDPSDTTQVIESNEATYNSGIDGDYEPTILSVTTSHTTAQLRVTVVGTNLSSDTPLTIGAASGIWTVPLTIVNETAAKAHRIVSPGARGRSRRTEAGSTVISLTGIADVPTLLPAAVVQSGSALGGVAIASVPPDRVPDSGPDPGGSPPDTVLFRDPNWSSNSHQSVYPKDFAFFYNYVPTGSTTLPWRRLYHLIYIRHNSNYSGDAAESLLVHAWSPNLRDWTVDKRAFAPDTANTNAWDHLHVWAPTIVPVGNTTYMFYTGVDQNHNQSIGYVTTSLLDTSDTQWSARTQVYRAGDTGWADQTGHLAGLDTLQVQFRDPCVIPDPADTTRYLLFVVGEDKNFLQDMVVGVARNSQSALSAWVDLGAYRATDFVHTGITRDESPLVMRDSTAGAPWRIFVANSDYDSLGDNSTFFVSESLGAALADTTKDNWSPPTNLYTYLGYDNGLIGWEACEHVQVGLYDYFAGYNGEGIAITRTRWDPVSRTFRIGAPPTAVHSGPVARGIRFYLSGFRPGVGIVRFELESDQPVTPLLALYDVAGRRVRMLLDGKRFVGNQEVRWDCCDTRGSKVPCGVYFARLTGAGPQQVRRVVVVR